MLKKYFIIGLIVLSCFACNNIRKEQKEIVFDTIKQSEKLSKKCSLLTKGYSKKYGIIISNYYDISDKLYYDINKDTKIDTLLILTPASMIPGERGYNCDIESKYDNRLLLALTNIDGKKSKIKMFKDIISNEVSAIWNGSEEFEKSVNGFKLQKSAGQGCKFNYTIYVNTENKQIVIDSITLSSFCPSDYNYKEKIVRFQKPLKIDSFSRKMIDSIKASEDL